MYKDIAPEDILRMEQEGKMEYTKGDWKARYAGHDLPWYIEAGDREVAKVLVYPIYPDNEAHANAHLMAAAPDMYEALEAIINSETVADKDNFNNVLAALAKAEGK